MSVIGIDFGNESCYVAVARAGGIETVDNDYSLRATASTVAFGEKQRILGVAAKNQLVTNIKNTVWGFKRFLGRKFSDPFVQDEIKRMPFKAVPHPQTGGVAVQVMYLGEQQIFSMEQIAAMLFTKLKETTEHSLQTKLMECVFSVPSYFTDVERKALLGAAETAGFKVLRLMNETAATSLTYGIYKQDLPESEENPRNVVFVDCGHSALQVWACAFNKGKLKILASTADPFLGGRNFDKVLADHFCEEFRTKYKMNVESNHRAYVRLTTEVEKLKKQMSANATKLPLNIECLMDDKDVTSNMCRADFEAMSKSLLERVERTLRDCLKASNLTPDEIHSVEIVGGSSRIPAIKQLIEKTFGKMPSTTLNQDEAVARGCALQCAILSPAYKVRDFKITDVQPYPIKIVWDDSLQEDGCMEVFPLYHPVPFIRVLTLYKRDSFAFKVVYSNKNIPYPETQIGSYKVENIASPDGDSLKVKVKARINMDGIFSISNVTAYERVEEEQMETEPPAAPPAGNGENGNAEQQKPEVTANGPNHSANNPEGDFQEPMETEPTKDAEQEQKQTDQVNGQTGQESNEMESEASQEDKSKPSGPKIYFKPHELVFQAATSGLTSTDVQLMTEQEGKMVAEDRREKARIDAKNALEEFIYSLRDKLECELREFTDEVEKGNISAQLEHLESWLYEDGGEEQQNVYTDRLEKLRACAEPIFQRYHEHQRKLYEAQNPPPPPETPAEQPPAEGAEQQSTQDQQPPPTDSQTPQPPPQN